MSAYTAAPLPPELWPGSQERWGVLTPSGEWLFEAAPRRAYWFVTEERARTYAAQVTADRAAATSQRRAPARAR